MYYKFDEDGY